MNFIKLGLVNMDVTKEGNGYSEYNINLHEKACKDMNVDMGHSNNHRN